MAATRDLFVCLRCMPLTEYSKKRQPQTSSQMWLAELLSLTYCEHVLKLSRNNLRFINTEIPVGILSSENNYRNDAVSLIKLIAVKVSSEPLFSTRLKIVGINNKWCSYIIPRSGYGCCAKLANARVWKWMRCVSKSGCNDGQKGAAILVVGLAILVTVN